MNKYNAMFYMGVPFMTDFLGGAHARRVKLFGVMMSASEALAILPDALRILQVTRN